MKKNKNVAVLANTHYIDKKQVGENVSVTLPSIEWLTQQIKGTGNIDIPLVGLTDALDCNVTTDGTSSTETGKYIKPGVRSHEFRWVKSVVKPNGVAEEIGCKAFLKMMSKNIPEIASEVQEAQESSFDYSVLRYSYYENGKQIFLLDKLTGDCIIDGVNYGNRLKKFL